MTKGRTVKADGHVRDWSELSKHLEMPSQEEIDNDYGSEFMVKWREVFQMWSYHSELYPDLAYYIIVGQMLRHVRIRMGYRSLDMRVHGLYMSPSGTGKGAGYGFVNKVCDDLKLGFNEITELTDAGLIGKNTEIKVRDGTKTKVEYETELGVLNDGGIIAMEEADVIFRSASNRYSKNGLTYIQKAQNPIDSAEWIIRKKTGGGPPIVTRCTGSFFFCSYIPDNLLELIVKQGFVQRHVLLVRDVTWEDRINQMKHSLKIVGKTIGDKKKDHSIINHRLKVIQYRFKDVNHLDFEPARKHFEKIVLALAEPIKDMPKRKRRTLEEFLSRQLEICYRIACIAAMTRLSEVIEEQDVITARDFIIPVWNELVAYMEDALDTDKKENIKDVHKAKKIINTIKEMMVENQDDWVSRKKLIERLAKDLDVSRPTANKRVKDLEEEQILDRRRDGNTELVSIAYEPEYED